MIESDVLHCLLDDDVFSRMHSCASMLALLVQLVMSTSPTRIPSTHCPPQMGASFFICFVLFATIQFIFQCD